MHNLASFIRKYILNLCNAHDTFKTLQKILPRGIFKVLVSK